MFWCCFVFFLNHAVLMFFNVTTRGRPAPADLNYKLKLAGVIVLLVVLPITNNIL